LVQDHALHVLKHGSRTVCVEEKDGKGVAQDQREAEADAFAQKCLTLSGNYERFCRNGDFGLTAIRRFASKLGIALRIVAGRLRYDRKIPFSRAN
jgi:hypothetical protein